ncbi:MAG: hypothetical protein IPO05_16695 [Flavobacteriales bacterium]|nr:hypothetical protein [Flavobacteriales bacterium]
MPRFISGYDDVLRVDGYYLQDALETAYAQDGDDEVCLVCRSNKRAYEYSQQVRARIHGFEEELCSAMDRGGEEQLLLGRSQRQGRIDANGEPMLVDRVHGVEERFRPAFRRHHGALVERHGRARTGGEGDA